MFTTLCKDIKEKAVEAKTDREREIRTQNEA